MKAAARPKKAKSAVVAAPLNKTGAPEMLIIGVALAFVGQIALLHTTSGAPGMGVRQLVAGILLFLGAVAFGYAASRRPGPKARLDFHGVEPGRRSRVHWYDPKAGIALAAGLAAAAIVLFTQTGETPVVIALWVISILVLFCTQFWRMKISWPPGLRRERPYLLGLIVVMTIALAERIYHLSTLPYNFDGDFASFGLQARALIMGAQPHIFAFGWAAIPMPGYLPAALTMRLFGDSIAGLAASGVIEGLLSILGVYLLGRDLFQPRLGLIAAALLAASYAHLAASREAQYVDPVPFVVFGAYFFLIGIRERRGWALAASGIMIALCLELYYSGRIVLPVILCILLFLALLHRKALTTRLEGLLLWLLALLVALGPMLVVAARDSADVTLRSRDVFILSPTIVRHTMGVYQVDTIPAMLLEQARRSALLFHYYPDADTQFSFRRPLLDPMTAPLFALGLGLAAFQWRRLGAAVTLAWIVLGVVLGCFLTVNPPFWTRLMVLLPPAAMLAALALDALYASLRERLVQNARRFSVLAPVAVSLLLLWIGVSNWNTYVQVAGSYANSVTRAARYMMSLPPSTRAYVVSGSGWTFRLREFEFLVPGRMLADLTPAQVQAGVRSVGSPTLLILSPDQAALVPLLPTLYPGGTLTTGPDNDPHQVAFYAYQIP